MPMEIEFDDVREFFRRELGSSVHEVRDRKNVLGLMTQNLITALAVDTVRPVPDEEIYQLLGKYFRVPPVRFIMRPGGFFILEREGGPVIVVLQNCTDFPDGAAHFSGPRGCGGFQVAISRFVGTLDKVAQA